MEDSLQFLQPETKEINLMEDQKRSVLKILHLDNNSKDTYYNDSMYGMNSNKTNQDDPNFDDMIDINGVQVEKQMFCFKALIIDDASQMMLSTITKMTDLRNCNITFHSKINKKRDSIRDTPVIYMVEPTEENIDHIVKDAEKSLYDFIFFAFTKPINNTVLETLALKLTQLNAAEKVMKVNEHYLSFFSHTPN